MLYLFDTNAYSDAMFDHPKIAARLASLSANDRVLTCAIVLGEVLFGIERLPPGARRAKFESSAAAVGRIVTCEPVPVSAAAHYARIKWARQQRGARMEENDLWIVAAALALGTVLVSRDADVQNVPGLIVEDWTV